MRALQPVVDAGGNTPGATQFLGTDGFATIVEYSESILRNSRS